MTYIETRYGSESRASAWLRDHGVVPFLPESYSKMFSDVLEQVRAAQMYPSLLEPRKNTDRVLPDTNALVIEIGGSKNRASFVSAYEFMTSKQSHNFSSNRVDRIEIPFPRQTFQHADDFFNTVLDLTEPAIESITASVPIQALAVVYSFPGPAVRTLYGIDIQPSAHMTKGFVVPGIERYRVGETLVQKLRERGYRIEPDASIVVTNDVVGGMIFHAHAEFSLIDGTGFNIGVASGNTESGDLIFPMSEIEKIVNQTSENPGRNIAETIAGGTYISSQLNTILSRMRKEEIIKYENEPLSAVHLTEILSDNKAAFINVMPQFTPTDTVMWNILTQIAHPIRERSKVVMGMSLAAHMNTHLESITKDPVVCTVEGSTLLRIPGLLEGVREIAEQFSGYQIDFVHTSGAKGAGFAALRQYAKQHS